jgi:hypothetical protein
MSDARWDDPREYEARDRTDEWPRVYDPRDRDEHDPREVLMRDLDLPRGDERELVVDRERVYELDGEDSRTLAAVGAFRIVPEHDLDLPRDTLDNLHDQRLVEAVELGDGERALTLTTDGRDLLRSHSLERDAEPAQAFYAGASRSREIDHDSNLYATFRQEDARLREEHDVLEIRRVVLEQDLKREYQEFLQDHNRDRADSDGRLRAARFQQLRDGRQPVDHAKMVDAGIAQAYLDIITSVPHGTPSVRRHGLRSAHPAGAQRARHRAQPPKGAE